LSSFLLLGDFLHSCGTRSQIYPCSKSIYFSPEINFAFAFQRAIMAGQLPSSVRHKELCPLQYHNHKHSLPPLRQGCGCFTFGFQQAQLALSLFHSSFLSGEKEKGSKSDPHFQKHPLPAIFSGKTHGESFLLFQQYMQNKNGLLKEWSKKNRQTYTKAEQQMTSSL